jgi:hypothetical protein
MILQFGQNHWWWDNSGIPRFRHHLFCHLKLRSRAVDEILTILAMYLALQVRKSAYCLWSLNHTLSISASNSNQMFFIHMASPQTERATYYEQKNRDEIWRGDLHTLTKIPCWRFSHIYPIQSVFWNSRTVYSIWSCKYIRSRTLYWTA